VTKKKTRRRRARESDPPPDLKRDDRKWYVCKKDVTGKRNRAKARRTIWVQTWYLARERGQVLLKCERCEMDAWLADDADPMC
jgi:hypothetical protein